MMIAPDDLDDPPMDDVTYDFLLSKHTVWEPASDPMFEDTLPKPLVHMVAVAFRPGSDDADSWILADTAGSLADGLTLVFPRDSIPEDATEVRVHVWRK